MRLRKLPSLLMLWVGLLAGAGAGCDSAPGVADDSGTPPLVENFDFEPSLIVFEQVPRDQIVGDSLVLADISISVSAADVDGDLDSVLFVINSPFDPFEPLLSGELNPAGSSNRFTATATVRLPKGNTGLYSLIVYAVDRQSGLSNQVRGLIEYQLLGGGPPEIVAVEGPESVSPPALFSFVAEVTDPDGLGNIESVVTRAPNGQSFNMFDDGQNGGDETAGDGRYTVTFEAPEGTPPGTVQFEFQAFDRQGNESNVVTRDLMVN